MVSGIVLVIVFLDFVSLIATHAPAGESAIKVNAWPSSGHEGKFHVMLVYLQCSTSLSDALVRVFRVWPVFAVCHARTRRRRGHQGGAGGDPAGGGAAEGGGEAPLPGNVLVLGLGLGLGVAGPRFQERGGTCKEAPVEGRVGLDPAPACQPSKALRTAQEGLRGMETVAK